MRHDSEHDSRPSKPATHSDKIDLLDLIDFQELQKIQDAFARATNVASIITDTDGVPLTEASNFSGVCQIIRSTEEGNQRCIKSDKVLGDKSRTSMRPNYQQCLSCGYVDASAPIIVDGNHIANWLIGQCNVMGVTREQIKLYALEIGGDVDAMVAAHDQIPQMPLETFERVLDLLWLLARQLSTSGISNLKLRREIAEVKRTEKALRLERDRSQKYLDTVQAVIVALDAEGRISSINKKGCQLFGCSEQELIGQPWFDVCLPQPEGKEEVFPYFLKLMSGEVEAVAYFENPIITRDGELRQIAWHNALLHDDQGRIVGTLSSGEDITDRQEIEKAKSALEKQLRQTQKMEAIGTLAGGIAHDFNNILSAVLGYTEMLQLKLDKGSTEHEYAHHIYSAGNRAKALVQQILTFSRQTEHELRPVDVNATIQEVTHLLRSSLPSTIEIQQNLQSKPLVMGDPTQLHQILMNLCTNAAHAMKDTGGVLDIELTTVELKDNLASAQIKMTPGVYMQLNVSDTGCGIPAEIIDRVFDPFFTTKKRGEGTGMGLSVIHGIVESYNGTINVYSEVGKGSTFRVFLPAIERRDEADKRQDEDIPTGNERILFIDDEPMLVELSTSQLETLGYHVMSRSSSVDALSLFEEEPDAFDLVITDLTMPRMTGDELAGRLKAIRPDIPIILCTGFSATITSESAHRFGIDAFLMKPIIVREMAKVIRDVLDDK